MNDNILVNERQAENFEGLLNVNDYTEAFISVVGNGRGMPVCERCYDEISIWEVERGKVAWCG